MWHSGSNENKLKKKVQHRRSESSRHRRLFASSDWFELVRRFLAARFPETAAYSDKTQRKRQNQMCNSNSLRTR